MEGEDCGMEKKKNQEVKEQILIDFAIETNDFLANFSSDETLDNYRFSVFMENRYDPDGLDLFKFENHHYMQNPPRMFQQQREHLPSELQRQRQRQTGFCDTRKSLAWDSAFFTSAGVLDPEELSIINRGFKKVERPVLPQILEDSWGSADPSFTLDADGISLESLEGDLFEDVRASIQKSSEAYKTASSAYKTGPGGGSLATKKLDVANPNQKKPTSTSRGKIGDRQQPDRIKNEVSYSPQTSGESKFISLKPSTTSNRGTASSVESTKRAKMENRAARRAGGSIMSKKSALRDSCNSSSTFTPPSRSCSTASPANDSHSAASCCTHKRSGGALSDPISKYSTNSIKRKVDPSSRIYSSGSTLKTPKTSRKTTELGNSSSSSLFSSITKVSSTSLSSSFDDWSPKSSPSTSSVSSVNLNVSHDSKLLGGPLLDGDSSEASHLQSHPSDRCKGIPSLRSSSVSTALGDHKPSGLRIPAPKIGFFDEGKSFIPALSGSLQFNSGKYKSPPKSRTGTSIYSRAASRIRLGESMKSSKEASCATGTAKIAHKSSLKAKEKGTLSLSTKSIERKSQQLCPKMNNSSLYRDETSLQGDSLSLPMKENGDVSITGLENSQHLPIKAKENVFGFEDPVDSLTRHVQGIDLGRDVIIEFKGKKGPARAVSRLSPSLLSLPRKTETVPRTRTPLATKESTYNNCGFFDSSTEPNTKKPEEKAF